MRSKSRINLWEFSMWNWCQLRHRTRTQQVNWSRLMWSRLARIEIPFNVHASLEAEKSICRYVYYYHRANDVSVPTTTAVSRLHYALSISKRFHWVRPRTRSRTRLHEKQKIRSFFPACIKRWRKQDKTRLHNSLAHTLTRNRMRRLRRATEVRKKRCMRQSRT